MRKRVKVLLALSLCFCMSMGGTVYAQGDLGNVDQADTDNQVKVQLEPNVKVLEETPEISKTNEQNTDTINPQTVLEKSSVSNEVPINETNFPDEIFREYIKKFDEDVNGAFSDDELSKASYIEVSGKGISDLTGIHYFSSLQGLNCAYNQLTDLDIRYNIALKELMCGGNPLSALDVSNNINLENLNCMNIQLENLDLSHNTSLKNLICNKCSLTDIDVSHNPALTELSCSDNKITSLDVSKNTNLTVLFCNRNSITNLDVSHNLALQFLQCPENCLTSLDLSNLTKLVPPEEYDYDTKYDTLVITPQTVNEKVEATESDDKWVIDLSKLIDKDLLARVTVKKGTYNPTTGIWTLSDNTSTSLQYEFATGSFENMEVNLNVVYVTEKVDAPTNNVINVKVNESEVKTDTEEIDQEAIYKAFQIDPKTVKTQILVEQKEPSADNKDYVTELVEKSRNKLLKTYDVVMTLLADGKEKGLITENFGKLKLSLYAGKEYAGKTAIVYQLHGDNKDVITYKNLKIDKEGMVTITVSKLSTFAVALQNTSSAQISGGNKDVTFKPVDSDSTAKPTDSNSTPESTRTTNKQITSPKTGDYTNVLFWILLFVLTGVAIVFSNVKRRANCR